MGINIAMTLPDPFTLREKENSMLGLLRRLSNSIGHGRRRQFYFLLLLAVITSMIEVISIGLISPFLAVLISPNEFLSNDKFFLREYLGINLTHNFIAIITILFGFVAIISGLMRLYLLRSTTRLGFLFGNDISYQIFRRSLYQPYAIHLMRNSSEIIDAVTSKVNAVIYSVVMPSLSLICAVVMLLIISITLLLVNPTVTLVAFLVFGLSYLGTSYLTKEKLKLNGQIVAEEGVNVIKIVQDGLGGIRDILIDSTQSIFCDIYRVRDLKLRESQGSTSFLAGSPRYIMESLGMILISTLAYFFSRDQGGLTSAIPVLGMFALGAQRMLPLLQQSYSSWASIKAGKAALIEVINLLEQNDPHQAAQISDAAMVFSDSIELKNASFRYWKDLNWVLSKVNLKIKRGSRIGIVGATGSGKSTLMDILMGLLTPEKGCLMVDGIELDEKNIRAWRKNIAHVPQHIFLSEGSIVENVAFGTHFREIDLDRVIESLRCAQILDFVESLPSKYWENVGERGVRLSGGQRQRIGIARALYKKSQVIIFDEATSALDNVTELAIIDSINRLTRNLTIIIIAHRLSTLKFCDEILAIESGSLLPKGSYENFSRSSA